MAERNKNKEDMEENKIENRSMIESPFNQEPAAALPNPCNEDQII